MRLLLSMRDAATWVCAAQAALGLVAVAQIGVAHGPANDAIERLSQQIESDGEDAGLHLSRGELHRAQGDWAAAERDFDRAAHLDSERVEVDLYRGRLMLDRGHYEQAEAAFSRLKAAAPDHAVARALRARALAELGRRREASEEYAAAIARQPSPSPTLYLERAQLLAGGDDAERREALRGLDAGITRLGGTTTLELLAIELELQGGKFDAALARLDRITRRSPRKDPWLVRRAEILEAAGRSADAMAALESALAAMVDLPESRRDTQAIQDLKTRIHETLQRQASRGEDDR